VASFHLKAGFVAALALVGLGLIVAGAASGRGLGTRN
jgi:hypothetical protein